MAALIDELNAVILMIGIQDDNTHMNIIYQERFMELADLLTLVTDRDVDEMAKHMAASQDAGGRKCFVRKCGSSMHENTCLVG